jgi:hypothetical protein
MKKSLMAALVVACTVIRVHAADVSKLPKCGEDPKAKSCVCNGEVREDDKVALSCSRWGINTLSVQGGHIGGADGTGPGGAVSVGIFDTKRWAVEIEGGVFQMGGLTVLNTQDEGPAVPGYPQAGNIRVNSVINSPATRYIPMADVKFTPVRLFHDRVRPFVGGEAGLAQVIGEAVVNSNVVLNQGGQITPIQTLPTQLQPTGTAANHFAGAIIAGANVRLDKDDKWNAVSEYRYAPTGYTVYSGGLQYNIKRHKKDDDAK